MRRKTVMVIDHGLYPYLAQKLSHDFNVLYHIPNIDPYPMCAKDEIGTGIPGIERVYDLYKYIKPFPAKGDKVDMFCFFDVGFGGLQQMLREMGYRTFGAQGSEKLEQDKWFFNEVLKKVGLPTAGLKKVIGTDALRSQLEKVQDKYIKISYHRGEFETYHHVDMWETETWLDDVTARLGVSKFDTEFLIQDPIESVLEIGYDGYNINGEYPKNGMMGIEGKDEWYVGRIIKELPPIMQHVGDRLAPVFKKLGYNGNYSSELRVADEPYSKDFKGKPYYIDLTARGPSPPSESQCEMYEDFGAQIWAMSEGKVPTLKPAAKYCVQSVLVSNWNCDHALRVKVPKGSESWLKLKNFCIKNGQTWIIPNNNGGFIGSVIAVHDSLDKACELLEERMDLIKAYELTCNKNCCKELREAVDNAKKFGIIF